MILIYTPDRAERLARAFEAQRGYEVRRLIEHQPIISIRGHAGMKIVTRVYARVSKYGVHRCNITYETIHEGSVIL